MRFKSQAWASAARADALHELDEVAGDEAAGRHRVGAGIAEAVAAAGPARDVEGAEVLDRHGPAAAPLEGAERGQEHGDDPGVGLREVREAAPVVGRGARRRLVRAEDALVHAGS